MRDDLFDDLCEDEDDTEDYDAMIRHALENTDDGEE